MIEAQDISLDENNDLLIKNGDFVIDLSDEVHVENILKSAQGVWKQYPLVGVNIIMKSQMPTSEIRLVSFKKQMKVQLEYDNYKVNKIDISNLNNIKIDCERIS